MGEPKAAQEPLSPPWCVPRLRLVTAPWRKLPDFLIIGAQRGGTTSLYEYLIQHPQVSPALVKEVHYFDLFYHCGLRWYKAHFPIGGRRMLTGEASPYYLFHPLVPQRVKALLPQVKLVVLLRNPVDRAYSHYYHERRLQAESLTFEEAISRESERTFGAEESLLRGSPYSFSHQHYTYLQRGIYHVQLKRWFSLFPRNHFFIIKSEDLFANPSTVLPQLCAFLGVKYLPSLPFLKKNDLSYPSLSAEVRQKLEAFFQPHNEKLAELLGEEFRW